MAEDVKKEGKEHLINPDVFYKTPDEVKKSLQQNKEGIKETIKQYLPDQVKPLLDSTEGTIFLIASVFIVLVIFFKIIGMFFNLAFKIIFIIATAIIVYFLYTYFINGGF